MKSKIQTLLFILIMGFISCNNNDDEVVITVSTSDFVVTIDENPTIDQVLGTVQGTTNQGNVVFSLIDQTPSDAFSIDVTTGQVTVADETLFDFETNPEITGVVKVTNGQVYNNSFVKINLNDIVEDVFNGDVTLTTQEEIDAFGSFNYRVIDGNLTIDEDQGIHNIVYTEKLASITTVTGNFTIKNMYNWLDVYGFENLISVGGIIISDNWGILDMHSLLNITTCTGDISITNNTDLGSFCGIRPLLQSGNFNGSYTVSDNFYNPTQQEIIDGNCDNF